MHRRVGSFPANGAGLLGFVADAKFSQTRGFYDAPFDLTISTTTTDAEIRYTNNGSPPSPTNGVVYTGAIPMNATVTLRAAAFKSGALPSLTRTHTFVFSSDAALLSLPIVSIGISPNNLVGPSGITGIQGGVYDQVDCCFIDGTPILMADGRSKPIEQVSVGDEVQTPFGPRPVVAAQVSESGVTDILSSPNSTKN